MGESDTRDHINRRRPLGHRMTNPDREAAKNSRPEAEEHGRGLYTLIVLLVTLFFLAAIKNSDIGSTLSNGWTSIASCVSNPTTCTAAAK